MFLRKIIYISPSSKDLSSKLNKFEDIHKQKIKAQAEADLKAKKQEELRLKQEMERKRLVEEKEAIETKKREALWE